VFKWNRITKIVVRDGQSLHRKTKVSSKIEKQVTNEIIRFLWDWFFVFQVFYETDTASTPAMDIKDSSSQNNSDQVATESEAEIHRIKTNLDFWWQLLISLTNYLLHDWRTPLLVIQFVIFIFKTRLYRFSGRANSRRLRHRVQDVSGGIRSRAGVSSL